MKKRRELELDFVVDRLTNSIQNTISGDSFPTEVSHFTLKDSKQITKKNGWNFNWKAELDNDYNEVYKLFIIGNPEIVQGLLKCAKGSRPYFYEFVGKRTVQYRSP